MDEGYLLLNKVVDLAKEIIKFQARKDAEKAKYKGFKIGKLVIDFKEDAAKGEKMPPQPYFKDGIFRKHYRKLEYRFMYNGKQISVCGADEEECYRKRLDIIAGKKILKSVKTFGQWLTEWANTYKKPNLTPNSFEAIERYIKQLSDKLGSVPLSKLTTTQLQKFLNNEPRSNTRTKLASVMSDSLNKAYATQQIKFNPYLAVEYKKEKSKSYPVLQPNEQVKVYEQIAEKKYKDLYRIALCTGMRISELIGLRVQDVDFDNHIITVKQQLDRDNNPKEKLKTDASYRYIDFLPELFTDMDLSREYLFEGTSYTAARSYFRRLFEKLNMEFVLHSFRHTFISNCYHVGISDKQIQLWAGHSKVEITINTYTHILKGDSPFIEYVKRLKGKNRP